MVKRRVKPKTSKTSRKRKPKLEPQVSRYEYSLLCLQLAAMESRIARNRTDLDIQLSRIAQLQHEVDELRKSHAATIAPPDAVLIPQPKSRSDR